MPLPSLLIKGNLVQKPTHRCPHPEFTRPIDYVMNFISDRIPAHANASPNIKPKCLGDKIVVLKSGTGSGKSTTIPPELYMRFSKQMRRNIAVTQPRVLTAIDIPRDIVSIPGYDVIKLYKNIGFSTGDFKRPPSENGIIFMTIGVMLQQFINLEPEKICNKYSFIVLDEVHERSIDLDTTLFSIKHFLMKMWADKKCPMFIFMSATFDPMKYMRYFDVPSENYIEIKGQSHPIEDNFAAYAVADVKAYAVSKAIELHEKNPSDCTHKIRDILIFVHSGNLAIQILEDLHNYNHEILLRGDKNFIAPITLTSESNRAGGREFVNVFSDIDTIKIGINLPNLKNSKSAEIATKMVKPVRRIIVATNVAETGVTIETLKYCIDTGLLQVAEFNPEFGISAIFTKSVTRGAAKQRRGRVGRKAPGVWYPCYTKECEAAMQEDQLSDMLTSDISKNLLNMICIESEVALELVENIPVSGLKSSDNLALKSFSSRSFKLNKLYRDKSYQIIAKLVDLATFDFFESPAATSLEFSMQKLFALGFIDPSNRPTIFGYFANKMHKLGLELCRMIFAGYSHGANILDLITIAAFLFISHKSVFKKHYQLRDPVKGLHTADTIQMHTKVVFADEFVDMIFLWNEFMLQIELANEEVFQHGTQQLEHKKRSGLRNIEMWCEKQGVNYDKLLRVSTMRDEIITTMLDNNLDPYFNGLNLTAGTYNLSKIVASDLQMGRAEIVKIKKCILDGFRMNLLKLNQKTYMRTNCQIPVFVRSPLLLSALEDSQLPKYIVVSDISLNRKFKFQGSQPVSVLDGFVEVDVNFLMN